MHVFDEASATTPADYGTINEQAEDHLAAVTYHIRVDGKFRQYCNKNFSDWFMTAEEMTGKMERYGIVPTLTWCW